VGNAGVNPEEEISRLEAQLAVVAPIDEREAASLVSIKSAVRALAQPFSRHAQPAHVTASSIVIGDRGTVLHWHKRLGGWLQPGGHIDAGETPWDAAIREAQEETGLSVTHAGPAPVLLHVDVHPAADDHVHLDLRYLLRATGTDDPSPGEHESPEARWFSWDDALAVADDALRGALEKARAWVASPPPATASARLDFDPARRLALASRVLGVLNADHRVSHAELIGSLAGGRTDRYSDIDIRARVQGCTDRDLFFALPELMAEVGPLLIEGWGFVAFPDAYIATFTFDAHPLFWQVDIWCDADEHVDGSDLLRVSRWEQLFKVWIHAAKLEARAGDYADTLQRFLARRVDVSPVVREPARRLTQLLDALVAASQARGVPYEPVEAACREILANVLS